MAGKAYDRGLDLGWGSIKVFMRRWDLITKHDLQRKQGALWETTAGRRSNLCQGSPESVFLDLKESQGGQSQRNKGQVGGGEGGEVSGSSQALEAMLKIWVFDLKTEGRIDRILTSSRGIR